jgi:hypothetical protein
MTVVRELWQQTCDFGTHLCRVERLEDRSGRLTITLHGTGILHQQPVTISNGGLEPSDVTDWQELCESILDDPARWNRVWL